MSHNRRAYNSRLIESTECLKQWMKKTSYQDTTWWNFSKTRIKDPKSFLRGGEKKQLRTGIGNQMASDFSATTKKVSSRWNDALQILKSSDFQCRILYPTHLLIKSGDRIDILRYAGSQNLPPIHLFWGSYWRKFSIKQESEPIKMKALIPKTGISVSKKIPFDEGKNLIIVVQQV